MKSRAAVRQLAFQPSSARQSTLMWLIGKRDDISMVTQLAKNGMHARSAGPIN